MVFFLFFYCYRSLFFLLFPIFLNIIFTNLLIKKEKIDGLPQFRKWWKRNRLTANAFRTASYLDTDALQIVSSGAGGIEKLSAPFSERGEKSILFVTVLVALLEDLPQLIIYAIYLRFQTKWAIVPILVIISCIIALILKSSAFICFTCCYSVRKHESHDMEKMDADDSSSSSSLNEDEMGSPAEIPQRKVEQKKNITADDSQA